jgi:hypothetical protein
MPDERQKRNWDYARPWDEGEWSMVFYNEGVYSLMPVQNTPPVEMGHKDCSANN